MVHFASYTDLVETKESQFVLPLPQRSPAPWWLRLFEPGMKIHVCQIPVEGLVEWLNQQIGQMGQAQWDLGHGYLVPKPIHVGPIWSNQDDSVAWVDLQLYHFAQDGYHWEGLRVQILPREAECMVGLTLAMKMHVLPGLTLNQYVEVGVFEIYWSNPLPWLSGCSHCLWCLHSEWLCP